MTQPIRVLHTVVNMNRGGAETLLMNLYRHIDHSTVQFDFLTSREGCYDQEIIKLGGIVHRIPYISDVGLARYIKSLHSFFLNHSQYKMVHAHQDKMSGFVLHVASMYGIPVRIAHSHNTQSEGGWLNKACKWYAGQLVNRAATKEMACSHAAARWLFDRQHTVQILHNGIKIEQFALPPDTRILAREQLGIHPTDFVVGHVGRFCRQKNHAFLMRIFAMLCRLEQNAVLVLIGDGPLRSNMEREVNSLGLHGRVKFLGIRNDVNIMMQAFDAFVFPSFHEGLPVVLIEAQAAGLTCVVSSAVTTEVDMGLGLIAFLPLGCPEQWVNKITCQTRIPTIQQRADAICDHGYDIRLSAVELQRLYLELFSDIPNPKVYGVSVYG